MKNGKNSKIYKNFPNTLGVEVWKEAKETKKLVATVMATFFGCINFKIKQKVYFKPVEKK